jgi:copper chaperone CopZ
MRIVATFLVTLVLLPGCSPPAPAPSSPAAPATTAGGGEDQNEQLVSIHVPNMHCPVMCWPKVKETLEAQPGVTEVVLAEQAEAEAIDNPRVNIKVTAEFDAEQAVEVLAMSGFADSTVE